MYLMQVCGRSDSASQLRLCCWRLGRHQTTLYCGTVSMRNYKSQLYKSQPSLPYVSYPILPSLTLCD